MGSDGWDSQTSPKTGGRSRGPALSFSGGIAFEPCPRRTLERSGLCAAQLGSYGPVLLARHDVSLRAAAFSLEGRWFLWSRARLYADRVELVGWHLWGRYHRVIPLGSIEEAEATGEALVLKLDEEDTIRIGVDAPEQWASAIATHRDVRER